MPFKLKDGKVDSSIVVAKNHIKEQDIDFYIVGFRGSANKSDWKINLETEQVPYGGSTVEEFKTFAQTVKADETVPMVHKGFNEYVNTVLSATMQDGSSSKRFVEEIKNNPKVRVLLTGHSLGGAVATLTAERLVSMGIEKWRVPVITFGAPAIGNAAFAKAYGDKILLWRITNTADRRLFLAAISSLADNTNTVYRLSWQHSSMIWQCISMYRYTNITKHCKKRRMQG